MNHERHDENDDDSRTGHLPQAGGTSPGINEDGTAEPQEADKGAYGVIDHGGAGRQKESDVAIEQDAFPELSGRELEKLLVAGKESFFSGALPPPDIFISIPLRFVNGCAHGTMRSPLTSRIVKTSLLMPRFHKGSVANGPLSHYSHCVSWGRLLRSS
ncbi:hypothetical protein [Bifidobacterium castoris]|uniref:hypothetical protein n=1 Tax=Bifidobacterium castoris TaxID=2306972 RepID=UPI000F7E72E5|nr:hypothetical protein [Bifidobacterium castoris]